jgi:hypothetical protein
MLVDESVVDEQEEEEDFGQRAKLMYKMKYCHKAEMHEELL